MKHKRISVYILLIVVVLLLLSTGSALFAASPGDIIVNEIMNNPSAVSDGSGEWFEVYNTTASDIDINGWTIRDDDIDSHVINNGGPLVVPAGGFLVLGNNTDSSTNGGVVVDYNYGSSWFLSNSADEVIIEDDALVEIDRVEYDGGPVFPDPNGASMSLSDPALDNNDGANWCEAQTPFGDGDLGTPQTANDCDTTPTPTATAPAPTSTVSPTPTPSTPTPTPPPVSGVIINEILADPASGLDGDANGDGVRDASDDEFLEIVNNTGADLDVSNWTISDGFGLRHTFPANTVIPDQCSVVVFGGGTPTGSFGGSAVQLASSGALGLNNSGDTVTVNDGASDVAAYTYGSEGGDNQSLTRDPDITGPDPLVKHTDAAGAAGALFSPGTLVDASAFSGCTPLVTIMEIQGNGSSSPLVGAVVSTEGVVTADFTGSDGLNGFFMQDPVGDGDPATSDGIFVYVPGMTITLGDHVRVTGEVQEQFGLTRLGWVSDITSYGPGAVVTPTAVTLPVAAVSDWEMVEGMLINIDQELSVSDNYNLGRYGELLLSVNGRLQNPTNIVEPGTDANDLQDLNNRSSIQLDDGSNVQNPEPLPPYLGPDNTLRAGDTTPSLTGVVGYAFSTYEIHPTGDVSFTRVNDRPEFPTDSGGSLKVASFNVLNYFTTIDNGSPICGPNMDQDCRGADSPEEFTRQRDKIISAIINLDADIIGLMEIENNESESLQDLVNGLNDIAGPGSYDFIDAGYVGSDAIKVGIIYQPANATPVGDFAILDSSVDPLFNDDKNRAVLAQTFAENASGEVLTVAVNHLKSKGSDCNDLGDPDTGDGQGNCNITRTNAALAEVNWLATDPTNSGDRDFMILGDLNAYNMEDPIDAIVDSGFTNLGPAFLGPDAYSYVFFGQAGALDHALSSPNLTAQVAGVDIWHINADEPNGLDYNTYNQPGLYSPDQYRSSDHDPVVVELNLTPHVTNEDGCYIAIMHGSPYSGAGTIVPPQSHQSTFNAISWASQEGLPNDACFEIHGNDKINKIRGGHAGDTLFGYNGDDGLIGGSGDDTFTGGPGVDRFIGQTGFDTVLDYEAGIDICSSIEAGCE